MKNYKYVLGIDDLTICDKTWFLSGIKSNGSCLWDNSKPIVFETEEEALQFVKDHDLKLFDGNKPVDYDNNTCRSLSIFLYLEGNRYE